MVVFEDPVSADFFRGLGVISSVAPSHPVLSGGISISPTTSYSLLADLKTESPGKTNLSHQFRKRPPGFRGPGCPSLPCSVKMPVMFRPGEMDARSMKTKTLGSFHVLLDISLQFSLVGFKGNLSPLDIFVCVFQRAWHAN